ncbi:DUF2141 domain-containing protein [Cellulophaga baltica]|uniref:DUF2141 domain-containing protein n=1 Tax=Cellulophaga TaxID=104264 RepID=UPI001C069486|nr:MULTISPECIES: DUF2141 domain-containing protein [Cellulophaga]MBU2997693.1 DUF2141 domain-containing protein [Cellulophaga baltica]MDO6769088.1 DUF2141 domain-containing protein [Cellulophaga sp. 1_MG-2023]
MRFVILCLLFFPILLQAQHKISVEVNNVKTGEGNVCVALYNKEKGFLKFDTVFKSGKEKANLGITKLEFLEVPFGTYAIAVFHDENSNDKLDTNFIGIPKESLGFSYGKLKTFSAPSFDECSFVVDQDTLVEVSIK